MRTLCSQTPKGIRWRDSRSYIVAERTGWISESSCLEIEGYVRGSALNIDNLVYLPQLGTFQIESCDILLNHARNQVDEMNCDDGNSLTPSDKQESLSRLGDVDLDLQSNASIRSEKPKAVRLDDHYYFDDDDEEDDLEREPVAVRVPKGTSKYQAAWMTGDLEEDPEEDYELLPLREDSEDEDVDNDSQSDEGEMSVDESGDDTDAGETESQSDMILDRDLKEEIADAKIYRRNRRGEAEEGSNLIYPDEIDMDIDQTARSRLWRYRALKSFQNSQWDPREYDERTPLEWNRFDEIVFRNYRALGKEARLQNGQVKPGTRVLLRLRNVSKEIVQEKLADVQSLTMYSLFPGENKLCVMNYSFLVNSENEDPLHSKEEFILQCGPRRWKVRPLFSQLPGNSSTNKLQKYERTVFPGSTCIASVIAPLSLHNAPALLWKEEEDGEFKLVATGGAYDSNRDRIIVKQIVVTGDPFKVDKTSVRVRWMFFNRDDVKYFKAAPLFTSSGRRGFIKETLGLNGYYKATFDGHVHSTDAVCMRLFKRVWPKVAEDALI